MPAAPSPVVTHLVLDRVRLAYPLPARDDGAEVLALADVTLEVGPGEFVAIVGPSGCGKTSLLFLVTWYGRHEAAILGLLGLAGLALARELGARAGAIDPIVLASPGRIGAALARQWRSGELARDLLTSGAEFGLAFALAVAAGVALGLPMGLVRGAGEALQPMVWLLYGAPLVAFQPLLIVWLGFGSASVVALAATLAALPIAVNVHTAVRTTDPAWLRAVRAFGGRRRHEILRVVLPASVPLTMAGLRIGAGRALVGVVVGEMFGADTGLGFRIVHHGARLRAADVLVPLLGIVLIGLAVTQAVRLAEHRLPGRSRGAG